MKYLAKFLITMAVVAAVFSSTTSCDPDIFNDDTGEKGDTLWVYEIPESENLVIPDTPMAIGDNGDIYFEVRDPDGVKGPRIYAITKDGEFKWKTQTLDNNNVGVDKKLNSPIVVGDDGTIFTTCGPYIYSVDPSNGQAQTIWECPLELTNSYGNTFNSYSPLINLCLTNEGNLIVQNIGTLFNFVGAIFCVTPAGQLKWLNKRQDAMGYPISIGPNGNIYDVGTFDVGYNNGVIWETRLVAYEPDNGNAVWSETAFPWNAGNKPVFSANGDVIYPLQEERSLSRMNINNNSIIWTIKDKGGYSYSVVDKNNNTFSHFYGVGNFFINGNATGDFTSPDNIYFPIDTNIDDKGNLIGRADYTHPDVVSSDVQGNKLWQTEHIYVSGPSITLEDDVLYFASTGNMLTGDNKMKIYAIKWDASLMHDGWPRNTHDNRNTSNYNKW